MPFGVVSGIGPGIGALDGVEIVDGKGAVWGINAGHPIVINGNFVAFLFSAVRLATQLFPNDFGEDLLTNATLGLLNMTHSW